MTGFRMCIEKRNTEMQHLFIKSLRVIFFSSFLGTTRSDALEKELKNLVVSLVFMAVMYCDLLIFI